ncbi:hypothetical protein C8R43DRAFT_72231 [Mycena crocata]|nr:hypothetical protein C8R43DRAFT_72231 [Mycena crocata]
MEFNTSLFCSPLLPTSTQRDHLRDLLRSNCLPHESSHFQSVVDSSPGHLARYDSDIEILRQLLDRLKSERAALNDYSIGCNSVFSSVRRLPNEVLTEIFALCAPELQPYYRPARNLHTFEGSVERAAQVHLLRLSQACGRWYHIATATPSLWATIEADFSVICCQHDEDIFKRLIQLSLDRSAQCPLTIACRTQWRFGGPCVTLLAHHSARWRNIDFNIASSALPLLSPAKGNVPLLERLQLGGAEVSKLDIFETAPRLVFAQMARSRQTPSVLPWGQLQTLIYDTMDAEELVGNTLAVVSRLPPSALFSVRDLNLGHLVVATSVLPPVCSHIRDFRLGLCDAAIDRPGSSERSREFLGAIMGMLTLPSLKRLFFESSVYDAAVFWPREQFLGLASRSSFHNSLTDLLLYNVVITSEDLIECLLNLPGLKVLFIQDVPDMEDSPRNVLITNFLLRRLVWTSEPDCLVPHLTLFSFTSFFQFDELIWLKFVASRLDPGCDDDGPFTMDMAWFRGHEPNMHDDVVTQIVALRDAEAFSWSLNPYKDDSEEPEEP